MTADSWDLPEEYMSLLAEQQSAVQNKHLLESDTQTTIEEMQEANERVETIRNLILDSLWANSPR